MSGYHGRPPTIYTLLCIDQRIKAKLEPGAMLPMTIPVREFELMGFDREGVAEYLEIERKP